MQKLAVPNMRTETYHAKGLDAGARYRFASAGGGGESCAAYGDALMYGGVKLRQAFFGKGRQEGTRLFPDFASELYCMEKEKGKN